jgi:hypothetical protein
LSVGKLRVKAGDIIAFAVIQVYEPVMHGLHLPEWSPTLVVVALGLLDWLHEQDH